VSAPPAPDEVACLRFDGDLAVLTLSAPHRSLPVIDLPMVEGLERAVSELERRDDWQGLLVRGRDERTFAAGADLDAIERLADEREARRLVERGQALHARFEDLRARVKRGRMVAAVGGACAGGAYELCLALDLVVAADASSTRIGLPEVKLGILPAWGGATRLPRRVGASKALDIILKGRLHSAKEALSSGMVDRLCAPEDLLRIAAEVARGERRLERRGRGVARLLVDLNPLACAVVAGAARRAVLRSTGRHYQAPLDIARIVPFAALASRAASLRAEAEAAGRLAASPTTRNLLRVFRGVERARKLGAAADGARAAPVRRLGVVGAGVMGAGIAGAAARRGIAVRLADTRQAALDSATRAHRLELDKRLRTRRMEPHEARDALDRLDATLDAATLRHRDAVIEAIVEQLAPKRELLARLEQLVAEDCLLATNTSSLSVGELQRGLAHPERVVGLHFFNPVERMPLVEVVRGERTSAASVARAAALALAMDKTPVVVADVPGFLVNRVLGPYLDEALALLAGGVPARLIDAALREFGMPMGPLELLDEVGFDVAAHAARTLASAYGERMGPGDRLDAAIAAGTLGRKSGRGFYAHGAGPARLRADADSLVPACAARSPLGAADAIARRLALATLAEAFRCLEERVVESEDDLDLAFVLGTGFAPFRGGPLRHARTTGLARVVDELRRAQDEPDVRARPGGRERFEPCPLLLSLAGR
jgi:3-hydroxyacyl-CoA dehydrogenase/enoyl-CoA hydratase/3-hydroxybutyryl-CoA epimerase